MATRQPSPFGTLLRRQRRAAGLVQEELAERAGLSVNTISALEAGRADAPRQDTLDLLVEALATALQLAASDRAALADEFADASRAARREEPQPEPGMAASTASVPASPSLPVGTLTFLLTDIEGSTALWEQQPAAMRAAIARHDAFFDELLARYGGQQVKERGEGDSIFAVFTSPSAALAAVCALQQALLAEPWPAQIPLRVRMGLHTGEADLREGGYYGVAVNRTARIRSLAHGGQILLSQATHDLARDTLPEGVSLRSLGAHTLKGLQRPEEVYQLVHPSLPAEFPPLASPRTPGHNLPVQSTSFIGREREQDEVMALLQKAKLVTLTGVGGSGKTRLALEVAKELLAEYLDGIWLVELASLGDSALVSQAVARVLGVREEPARSLLSTLADSLQPRHLLLVLDNCEHLIEACVGLVIALLRTCPHLHILASSRERLEVAGETSYRVPSLAVPDPDHLPAPERLPEYEAVQLFLERAQARRSDFTLTAKNAQSVAQVCARLDGIPLAIELAAARVSALSVEGIAARLDDCFRLLTGGPRTALPRQQTLRATLDWSYNLLSTKEQVLFRRLSVFRGGWTLEAAETVCTSAGIAQDEVLNLLVALVDKSLVLLEDVEDQVGEVTRYHLLETVRQYAWENLLVSGEAAALRDRHLAWYLRLAEQTEPLLLGGKQRLWMDRLEVERDNLRTALGWSSAERQRREQLLRLATALWRFWEVRGPIGEGRRWLDQALAESLLASSAVRAKALNAAGRLATRQSDRASARASFQESFALWQELGDNAGMATALYGLGFEAASVDDFDLATLCYEKSLALYRESANSWGMANALHGLGSVAYYSGDMESAGELFEAGLTMRRELEDTRGTGVSLLSLGWVALKRGEYEQAKVLYEESLTLRRYLGDKQGVAAALGSLGQLATYQGEYARARSLHGESLALHRELGHQLGTAMTLAHLASTACYQADFAQAMAWAQDSLTLLYPLQRAWGIAYALGVLGSAEFGMGDNTRATMLHKECLTLLCDQSTRWYNTESIAQELARFAELAQAQDESQRAARLLGASDSLYKTHKIVLAAAERTRSDCTVATARAALGDEAFAAAWDAGSVLSLEEATAYALEAQPSAGPDLGSPALPERVTGPSFGPPIIIADVALH